MLGQACIMVRMTFEEAADYVSSLAGRGWRMGLDRMSEFARRAGLGEIHQPKFIHIGGTNGKGSTTAYVQSILVGEGYRVGGFFSPFVVDLRERIQLNGEMISKAAFAEHVTKLRPIADSFDDSSWGRITEFEFKTALGMRFWEHERCDFVALEVGMGGRLDATNIVDSAVSVITSIGLDHTEHLGHTHAAIAREKAGIIKPGSVCVVGEVVPDAMSAITAQADEVGAELWRLGHEIRLEAGANGWRVQTPALTASGLQPGMIGRYQPQNLALAVAACAAAGAVKDHSALAASIAKTRLPGRYEQFCVDGVQVIVDGAHNIESAEALRGTLEAQNVASAVLLIGMLTGHDCREFVRVLAPIANAAVATPIDFHRSLPAEDLAVALADCSVPTTISRNSGEALDATIAKAKRENCPVLVTGSFYLAGEVIRALQLRRVVSAQK